MNFTRNTAALSLILALAACGQSEQSAESEAQSAESSDAVESVESPAATPAPATISAADSSLAAVLAAQPEEARARYGFRHPEETLKFFGIEPGMNVIEALPGGGWYTKILAPYLGLDGTVVGVDYNKELWPLFGFMDEETLAAKETWPEDWSKEARAWFDGPVADIEAFQFGSMTDNYNEEMDAVLFIRALHNMARFSDEQDFMGEALGDAYKALRPGGVVGVVQHMAPDDAPDDWADGSRGYLKKSYVIEQFANAGFEMVAESDINVNPLDQPTTEDVVWRLPPTLMGSRDNPEAAEAYTAIGESTRMTLLFRKPE